MPKCDGCTLCCEIFHIESFNKPAYEMCEYCILEKGCSVFGSEKRYDICNKFTCSYAQVDKASKDVRPDKCGVIFEMVSSKVFYGTQDMRRMITSAAKGQIDSFLMQGISVILQADNRKFYIAKNHTKDMVVKEVIKYLKGRNDATIIHN